jgi:hypothetical protein
MGRPAPRPRPRGAVAVAAAQAAACLLPGATPRFPRLLAADPCRLSRGGTPHQVWYRLFDAKSGRQLVGEEGRSFPGHAPHRAKWTRRV